MRIQGLPIAEGSGDAQIRELKRVGKRLRVGAEVLPDVRLVPVEAHIVFNRCRAVWREHLTGAAWVNPVPTSSRVDKGLFLGGHEGEQVVGSLGGPGGTRDDTSP